MSHQCPGTCAGTLVTDDGLLMCTPCWKRVPKPVQRAVHRAWAAGRGKGSRAHLAACEAAIRSLRGEPEPAPEPSPHELWAEAGEDPERYRDLMRQHGLILAPGDEGYEDAPRSLPCGWPGPQRPDWDPGDG